MTGPGRKAAPYLPPSEVCGEQMEITTWAAVSVPSAWGPLVRDALGDECGPVMEDAPFRTYAWMLPAGGGADWPGARAAGVIWHGPGEQFYVPSIPGRPPVTYWVKPPTVERQFTDPALLRVAIEFVTGPLAEAATLGPLVVCRYCGTPTRDGLLTESVVGASDGGYEWYACRPCWAATVGGGDAPHLRVVKRAPQ